MSKIQKILVITEICITMTMAFPVLSHSIEEDLFPYAGIDYEWTLMKGHDKWKKILPSSYNGGNFYAGVRVCDVAAEIGYDFTTKKRNDTRIIKTRVRTDSWHIDLNAFFPIYICTEAIGTIGLASTKATISAHVHHAQRNLLRLEPINANRKTILRLGGGVQYLFEECIGIRGLIRWKHIETFRLRSNSTNQVSGFSNKPCEDAVSITVGVFSYF